MKQSILGYDVDSRSVEDCVDSISGAILTGDTSCRWLACLNPHSYAVAKNDSVFREALCAADWLIPDGVGIVLAGRILRRPLSGRITGFDVFEGVMADLDETGGSVFFLGSTEETLQLIRNKLPDDYPNICLAGTYSPPFSDRFTESELLSMKTAIAQASPDVLWVGMTAPKQEKWLFENHQHLPVSFAGAIGAVFDFYTGKVRRSHPAFRTLGLEWLPRLVQQPRRLWRRMFVSAPIFMRDVFSSALFPARRNAGDRSKDD